MFAEQSKAESEEKKRKIRHFTKPVHKISPGIIPVKQNLILVKRRNAGRIA